MLDWLSLYCFCLLFSRPYWLVRSRLWYDVLSVCRLSVCNVLYCGTVRRRGSAMVPLDRALVSSYRLSIVTMSVSLTAAVWPQFATQVFRGGIGRLTWIGSYVNKQVTTFTFRAQATACSKHHTRQLWTQVASVNHEYGWLTLATAGLLFKVNTHCGA